METTLITDSQNGLLAIATTGSRKDYGTSFATPPEATLQLGFMRLHAGHKIAAHAHYKQTRKIDRTSEVLLITEGTLRATIHDNSGDHVKSLDLPAPAVLILLDGGHSFECLSDVEMTEVKQGPYSSESDKYYLSQDPRE